MQAAAMGKENNTNNHGKDKENVQLRASLGRIALGFALGGSILLYRVWQERNSSSGVPERTPITAPNMSTNPAEGLEKSIGGAGPHLP